LPVQVATVDRVINARAYASIRYAPQDVEGALLIATAVDASRRSDLVPVVRTPAADLWISVEVIASRRRPRVQFEQTLQPLRDYLEAQIIGA